MPPIAAIVAAHNRPRLLRERSLASIAAQERPPDYVIVADDSDADIRRVNRETVAGFAREGAEAIYIENLADARSVRRLELRARRDSRARTVRLRRRSGR